jgi:hypothetical protein
MKKLTTLVSFLMLVNMIFGQETQEPNSTKVKYVYSQSTVNSYNEMCDLLHNNKEALNLAMTNYKKSTNEGKIILSTIEYMPIAQRISKYESNNNVSDEEKTYVQKALGKYVLVTDLIEK